MKTHETDRQDREFIAAIITQLPKDMTPKQKQYWIGKKKKLAQALRVALMNDNVDEAANKLLELLGTVTIPATTETFSVKDRFVVNISGNAEVKISYLGDNFKAWFLSKIELPKSVTDIDYYKLCQSSVDKSILDELGGEQAETTLAEVYDFIKIQRSGEEGKLLNNGYANIFYVCDINGALRAVHVYWLDGGWYVGARSVGDPRRWRAGRRVFSSNF